MYFVENRGRGDSYQLGHGIGLHVRYPKVVEALHDKFIIDVAVGRQHCLAVTKEMGVYFWGTHDFEKEEDSCIREPTHVHQLHGTRDVGIAAGPAQVRVFVLWLSDLGLEGKILHPYHSEEGKLCGNLKQKFDVRLAF